MNLDKTFKEFVAAINSHDVESLTSLMTEDHLFVDSLGNRVQGAGTMRIGWRGYFAMCPDYRVEVSDILIGQDTIMATGNASGTIDGAAWQTPAAWRATIQEDRVSEWRVFADNKPVYEILARRSQ